MKRLIIRPLAYDGKSLRVGGNCYWVADNKGAGFYTLDFAYWRELGAWSNSAVALSLFAGEPRPAAVFSRYENEFVGVWVEEF